MTTKYFYIVLSISLLVSCRHNIDLKKVTSTERYFSRDKPFDTTAAGKTAIIKSLDNKDSICGDYTFIVWPGYDGHELIINHDSTFKENHWSDVLSVKDNSIKGKWMIQNGDIILKYKNHKYRFVYFEYKWATFLIPASKVKLFNVQFQKNKDILDNLSMTASNIPSTHMQDTLSFFAELCFVKFPIKNKP